MKGFAKIALSVALISIITLSVVVASVAWFTSNPEVTASDVVLNSSRTLTVSFDATLDGTTYRYNGQIGNRPAGDDEEDAPYVYEAGGFSVRIDSLSTDESHGKVKVGFGTVLISTNVSGMGSIPDVLITDLFHITANVYQENVAGAYVKDETDNHFRSYVAAEDEGMTRYNRVVDPLTIADDGTLMNGASAALFSQGSYQLSFTYTFLPEAAYTIWLAASAPNPTHDFSEIVGYERVATGGTHIGVVTYTAYKEKYHYGLQRYTKSDTAVNGEYTYTPNDEGEYVRVVTSYQSYESVTKYRAVTNPETGDVTYSSTGEGTFGYIKVGDSNDYVVYSTYNTVNGFPYSDERYLGETFTFTVICTVEEA